MARRNQHKTKPKPKSEKPAKPEGLLVSLPASFLVLIVATRIYAAYFTTIVRTWDDAYYRKLVDGALPASNLLNALRSVLLPNSSTIEDSRSIGYQSWLILFRNLLPNHDPERVYQTLNVCLFFAQGTLVYLFGLWASRRKSLALSLTTLYLSMPLVFGLNRWVMTENHLLTALIFSSFMGAWLIDRSERAESRADLLRAAGVAWGFGVMSTMREYALAAIIGFPVATLVGLCLKRRPKSAWVFGLVFSPFAAALGSTLPRLITTGLTKTAQTEYYISLLDWAVHTGVFQYGPAASLALVAGSAWAVSAERGRRKRAWDPYLIAHLAVLISSVGVLAFSSNRSTRGSIPILVAWMGAILLVIRQHRDRFQKHWDKSKTRLVPSLLVLALAFQIYALFYAYPQKDGVHDFKIHPYDIHQEIYNHPLHIRPLNGPDDMHITVSQ